MRNHVRASAVAGVAIALVLALPLPSPAQPLSAVDRADDAHASALRILQQVRAVLSGEAAPTRSPDGVLPRTDLTLLLRDLRHARPALTSEERATADSYLARPTAGTSCSGGTVTSSTHFCLHYSSSGTGGATPTQVTTTLATLEHVWSREIGGLGFHAPPADSDGLFDVYLDQLGNQGLYGYCVPDTNASHSTSYCVLDNDYATSEYGAPPLNSLRVTAAHEFFHAIQFGYDTGEDIWFMEGTAVWAEEQVYPTINDYVQYLRYSAITHPRTPADYGGIDGSPDVFYRYGAVLFWKFLSKRFGSPTIVRRVWEFANTSAGSRYSVQAVAAAVAERGWSFRRTFGVFGAWNTLPANSYDDRGLYPAPAWWRTDRLTRSHRSTGGLGVTLDHLTNAALSIRPGKKLPRSARVRVKVNAPSSTRMPYAMVQVRKRDGSVSLESVPLDSHGDGSTRVTFNPRVVSRVVVTLTNGSNRMTGRGTDSAERFACAGTGLDDNLAFYVSARLRRV